MAVVFMDIDDTLLDGSTGRMVFPSLWKAGVLTTREALLGVKFSIQHSLGLLNETRIIEDLCQPFVGQSVAMVQGILRSCVEQKIRYRIRQEAMDCMAGHRDKGDWVILLTSTSRLVAELIAPVIGVERVIALFQNTRDGLFMPGLEEPVCHGPGKAVRVRAFAQEEGVDLSQAFFYTDSFHDIPTLEIVGNPRVVNPDWKLRRAARERGWPILRWSPRAWKG